MLMIAAFVAPAIQRLDVAADASPDACTAVVDAGLLLDPALPAYLGFETA